MPQVQSQREEDGAVKRWQLGKDERGGCVGVLYGFGREGHGMFEAAQQFKCFVSRSQEKVNLTAKNKEEEKENSLALRQIGVQRLSEKMKTPGGDAPSEAESAGMERDYCLHIQFKAAQSLEGRPRSE